MPRPALTILLASPRGFCAGVDRAIQIVERAIERFGTPVYVRHEIVHNRHVVQTLEAKGAIFVQELNEVPADATVVFSAHGVPKSVTDEAGRRQLVALDATCPLVTKVHREAERHHAKGDHVILIGHDGHPEVVGTMGQLPAGSVTLIETAADVADLMPPTDWGLAFVTQTTLSVTDTAETVAALRARFPEIHGPKREDICYATTNRQHAVKTIANQVDALIVIGASNSSNSRRLVEVAQQSGCPRAILLPSVDALDWDFLDGVERLGVTAGASAPEVLVEALLEACHSRFAVTIEAIEVTREDVRFTLPNALSA
ncbi:MAG TPA: 4-hydroxy-3-methylbut-2-enyl diphosphate reductase [Stellaceae bacterium]|nr:4-hydroxy-3-methylbut-2-enyl diphosphate reductase [Stellaceae bacterium]